jgi:hypothetical protein
LGGNSGGLASITVLTEELINASNAEALVRDVLLRSVGLAVDAVLFDAKPANDVRPAGLLNGVAPIAPSTATKKFDAMVEDLSTLAAQLTHVGGRICYIMSPDRAINLRLRAHCALAEFRAVDALASAAVPSDVVIAVAADALVSVMDSLPDIRSTINATIHMETAPLPISTPGTPPTMAAPIRSLWQTNSIGLHLRFDLDWALRTPTAVAWIQGPLNW